jgi:hypothetical protein
MASRFPIGAKNLTIKVTAVITRPSKEELVDLSNLIFRAGTKASVNVVYSTKRHGVQYEFASSNRSVNSKLLRSLSVERPIVVDNKWVTDGDTVEVTEGWEYEMSQQMSRKLK